MEKLPSDGFLITPKYYGHVLKACEGEKMALKEYSYPARVHKEEYVLSVTRRRMNCTAERLTNLIRSPTTPNLGSATQISVLSTGKTSLSMGLTYTNSASRPYSQF